MKGEEIGKWEDIINNVMKQIYPPQSTITRVPEEFLVIESPPYWMGYKGEKGVTTKIALDRALRIPKKVGNLIYRGKEFMVFLQKGDHPDYAAYHSLTTEQKGLQLDPEIILSPDGRVFGRKEIIEMKQKIGGIEERVGFMVLMSKMATLGNKMGSFDTGIDQARKHKGYYEYTDQLKCTLTPLTTNPKRN